VSICTSPLVIIGVIENISHSSPKMCQSTILHSELLGFLTLSIFLVLVCGTHAESLSAPFRYIMYREMHKRIISSVKRVEFVSERCHP
jgi:hypothetical protein